MPTAEQLTAIAAIVAAIGGIVTSVLTYMQRGKISDVHATTTDVAKALDTGNGHTVGENSTQIARQVLPGRAAEDAEHESASGANPVA